MRRLVIAVCLLLLWPISVRACIEHGAPGWFTDRPQQSWEIPRVRADAIGLDDVVGMSVFLGSSGAGVFGVLFLRALCRRAITGRQHARKPVPGVPLAVPSNEPVREIIRVDEGHHESQPAGIVLGDGLNLGEVGPPVNFADSASCCPVGW
jgi:hypothetical protein